MKEEIIEYYPNGRIKYKICYYENGGKDYEQFYDKDGRHHRENNLPDYQEWFQNGMLGRETYCIHGISHNIYGPADLGFNINGKIQQKFYFLNDIPMLKLNWKNKIKNI